MHILLPLLLILTISTSSHAKDIYIIIHGTWAAPYSWHMPGGDFHDTLAQSAAHPYNYVSFFRWSGKNNHKKRADAALMLIELMKVFDHKNNTINIIAHSHGANVGIIASQILGQTPHNTLKIDRFFALGVPVCNKTYMPDMTVINHFYNMFSYSDLVQPVFGIYGREFPAHERIANIRVFINSVEPIHAQLHNPLLAQWIPMIHYELQALSHGNFDLFDFKKPGIINFQDNTFPVYSIDTSRAKYRAQDAIKLQLIEKVMRKRHHSADFSFCLTKRSSIPLMNR